MKQIGVDNRIGTTGVSVVLHDCLCLHDCLLTQLLVVVQPILGDFPFDSEILSGGR